MEYVLAAMAYTEQQLAANAALLERGVPVAVDLVAHEGKRTRGTMRSERLSPEEAGRRARRFLFTFLGIAVVSVCCPPHIPWPILCVTIALVGYRSRKKAGEVLLGGRADCPQCGALQLLEGGPPEFPAQHFCTECNARSIVERAPAAAAPADATAPSPTAA